MASQMSSSITGATIRGVWAMVLGGALAIAATGQAARAQSDSDIRKQNQQLATRLADMEKELAAARKEADAMRQRVADLEAQLAAARKGTAATQPAPLQPEPLSIDDNDPATSPRALLKAITASYAQTTAGIDAGHAGDGKRRAYIKKLEGWKSAMDRQYRGPITWHVQMVGDQPVTDKTRIVRLQAVDPKTGTSLGEPFDVVLSRLISDRIAQYEERGELDVMVLRGVVIPSVRINERRDTRGAFDNPPFIGPFAEFNFAVEARSLLPVKDDQNEAPAAGTAPAASTKPSAPAKTPPPGKPTPEK